MYTQNEMNAVLEEAAQKLGITLEGLKLAVWQQEEDDGLRSDIKEFLEEEGLAYDEEEVSAIFDNVNTDRGEDTRMRIDVAYSQTMDAIVEMRTPGYKEFIRSYLDDENLQYTAEDVDKILAELLDMPASDLLEAEAFEDCVNEAYIRTQLELPVARYDAIPEISNMELSDDGYITGTVKYGEESCAFEYKVDTEEVSLHKYSQPGWLTGSSYETHLPVAIENNLEEIVDAILEAVTDFEPEVERSSIDDLIAEASAEEFEADLAARDRERSNRDDR